ILVVDDDPDIITAVKAGFADSGAHLETAGDGTSAVKLAESKQPDLVILDIMLPQKSGFLVLEQLRRNRSPGEKPHIIMITGNQGKRHRQYAEALGVADYISKPFAIERLVESAEKLLSQ
ncbi:MAG: response regulator, partial [Planctomycetota bacterium]